MGPESLYLVGLFINALMLCLHDDSWGFLELTETSWSIQKLPDDSYAFCFLLFFIAFCKRLQQHQNNNKQTNNILRLWETQSYAKIITVKSTVSLFSIGYFLAVKLFVGKIDSTDHLLNMCSREGKCLLVEGWGRTGFSCHGKSPVEEARDTI